MGAGKRILVPALMLCLLSSVAFAHYQFLHYTSRTGPFVPVPEKFNLNALPNRTLQFFISDREPDKLAPGDSFASVVSQIRLAASAWSGVETSELRLEYGGLFTPGTLQSTPGIDVFFDELPPGLVAMAGPTTRAETVTDESGAFVPITRSILVLQKDLSQRPSYGDAFFMTAVHELGHTFGLQHTLSSSVMSTQITRATTRSRPLADDDAAGLSVLYPTPEFASQAGTITGRVAMDGTGVHLASVVAIAPSGVAVSALSDPDGYYRIAGVPPGQYYLYVHPLPPALQPALGPADIVLPVGPDGSPFPAGPQFQTQLYPGTQEFLQARVFSVYAGSVAEGFDFAVRPRGPLQLYGVTTYSFPGNFAVKPAFVNVNSSRRFLVASGVGLTTNSAPTPGLQAAVIGGSALVVEDGVRAYAPAPEFLQVDLHFNPFSSVGPRHLLFSLNNDIYVLPAGLNIVQRPPPSISSATPVVGETGRPLVRIKGTNLSAASRILFDGLTAPITAIDESDGALVVAPPPGASSHRATIIAMNGDGQDSLFLDALAPASYTYEPAAPLFASVSPKALPAGSEAMIEVTGVNTHFVSGQTTVGFGSSDIVVRQVWVLNPTHLVANIHTASTAPMVATRLTVTTGFETVSEPAAFQIQAGNPRSLVVHPAPLNSVTGQPSIYAGGQALLSVSNLPEPAGGVSLTLNDQPATVLSVAEGQITFAVPGELSIGPAVLRLRAGAESAAPILVQIDPPPPIILAVYSAPSIAADRAHPVAPGQLLTVKVAGLADVGIVEAPERLRVSVAGVDHVPARVYQSETDPNVHLLEFNLTSNVPAGAMVPLTVRIDYRVSQPFSIFILGSQ